MDSPTLVIGRKGTAGRVWLAAEPCWPSDTTFYLKWKRPVSVAFLFGALTLRKLSGEHPKTTLPSLQKPFLERHLIPFPPLPEQERIAALLCAVQEAKEKTGAVIQAARELKKSLMKHRFTYGPVPVEEADKVPLKETEIGEVREGWEVKELVGIATLQRGKDLPRSKQVSGPYAVIGSSGIMGYHNEYVVRGPGVVTGRSGSIGNVTYTEENYWPHNTGLYVKDFHGNIPKFIYYLLHRLDFQRYATGVSVPTLNRNFIHAARLAVPPLGTQQKIAAMLSTVDERIEVEQKRKTALEALFKTQLHHLMTGKVRVNDLEVLA